MAEPTNGRGALLAGGLAAILASTCCLGPLVLLMLGVSGAWIVNLTALGWRLVAIAALVVVLWLLSTILWTVTASIAVAVVVSEV